VGLALEEKVNTNLRARNFKSRLDIIVAIFGLALVLTLSIFGQARAGETKLALVTPNDVKAGSLLLKSTEGGKYLEAPRLATDFNVTVSGPTARTIVTQRFENPADGFVEGVYVFPLPENSAVDTLKIIAGNRVIIGEVKERQEAKVIYETAKASGQAAALLEQERPNLFTNSVANIGPHETVIVQIEYQETVKQTSGTFSLRLPLVVAPRYMPAPIVQSVDFSSDGFGVTVNDPVPDRERINPPVLDPKHALRPRSGDPNRFCAGRGRAYQRSRPIMSQVISLADAMFRPTRISPWNGKPPARPRRRTCSPKR
jgi:Ca-activated chloride channel family protein